MQSYRLTAWMLILLGWVLVGFSFPVDGLPGVALGLIGLIFFAYAFRTLSRGGAR
jgi:hypothetical protein